MITILNGKLTIPENERFIGFAGDNLARTIQFLVADETSAQSVYRLYLTFDDGTVNYFVLPSEVTAEGVVLTWNVLFEHIFKNGIVKAQIKAFLDEDVIYHTNADTFIVGDSPEFADYLRAQSTEFLEYEKTLNELYKSIRDGVVATEMIADEAVTKEKIAQSAVTTDKINKKAVTPDKLDRMYWECIPLMGGLTNATKEYTSAQINDVLKNEDFTYNPARTLFYAVSDETWEMDNGDVLRKGLYIGIANSGLSGVYFTNTQYGFIYYYSVITKQISAFCPHDNTLDKSSINSVTNKAVAEAIEDINVKLTNLNSYERVIFAGRYSTINEVMTLGTEADKGILYVFELLDEANSFGGTGKCIGYVKTGTDEEGTPFQHFDFVNLTKGGVWRYEPFYPDRGITQISNKFLTAEDVDSELSVTSENPVQNRVVKQAVKELNSKIFDIEADMSYFSLSFSDYAELRAYEFVQGYRYFLDLEAVSFDINGTNVFGSWEACLSGSNKLKLWNCNVNGYYIIDLTKETLAEATAFYNSVDSELSTTSTRPVQNKSVTQAIKANESNISYLHSEIAFLTEDIDRLNSTLNGLETFLAGI